jgi:hypothetical protein
MTDTQALAERIIDKYGLDQMADDCEAWAETAPLWEKPELLARAASYRVMHLVECGPSVLDTHKDALRMTDSHAKLIALQRGETVHLGERRHVVDVDGSYHARMPVMQQVKNAAVFLAFYAGYLLAIVGACVLAHWVVTGGK